MDLFEIIPTNFFNLFLSKNRELYVQSLLLIYKETKDNTFDLTENQCFAILSRFHKEKIFKYIAEEFDGSMPKDKIIENYAKVIINSLCHYGWLEKTTSLEEKLIYLSIPSYSIQFLEAIKNIINPSSFATEKCITNIYSNIEVINKNNTLSAMHIENAYESVLNLERLYSEMTFNIKIYYNRLIEKDKISNLIEEHFDNYIASSLFNKYYSLKTDDNVFKFRYTIINKVDDIINDSELIEVISKQASIQQNKNEKDVEDDIILKLDKIKTVLEDADRKQNAVNRKHNQYVGATLDRINYLRNRDEDFKGNLINILNILSKSKDDRFFEIINENKIINNYQQYSEKSIYHEKKKKEFNPEGITNAIKIDSKESIENQRKNIISKNKSKQIYKFRDAIIEEYIQNNLKDKDEITTEDFEIKNNDDFIKFVMAYKLTQRKKCKFESKVIDDNVIEIGEWKIPNIRYRRKGEL